MKQEYVKKCPWCMEEFNTTTHDQVYCKPTHRTYMSQYKNGKKDAPLVWSKKEKEQKLTPEVINQKIKEFEPNLEILINQLKAKREQFDNLYNNYESNNSKVYNGKTQKKSLLKIGNGLFDKEQLEQRKKLSESITNSIIKLEDTNKKIDLELVGLGLEYKKINLSIFRLKELINDLNHLKIKMTHKGIIPAFLIDKVEESITKYEFGIPFWEHEQNFYVENYFLMPLGTLKQPFLSIFIDRFELWGFYNYFQRIGENLVKEYDTKVLYIIPEYDNDFLSEIKEKGINLPNYLIYKVENRGQIEKAINDIQPEFLFLLDIKGLDLNYYKNLQKQHPKTSVFVFTTKTISDDILKLSDLVIEENEENYDFKKGGIEDFLVDAVFM